MFGYVTMHGWIYLHLIFFSWIVCCGLNDVLGVKASLTLGREEKPFGEGVSWAQNFSWEILLLERGYFMEYGLDWSHMPFYCAMGGIREVIWWGVYLLIALLWKVLEALLAYCNCKICCFIRIWHSPPWKAHLHPMFHDSNGESLCKPWLGF